MRTFLRLLANAFSRMLGIDQEAEKADMHLTNRSLGLALSAFIATFVLIARYIFTNEWFYLVLSAGFFFIFLGILLCYKNQRIYIISDEEFVYSTMFGRKTTYRFDQIEALRRNRDSLTLFVGGGKVHIESGAFLSERLRERIIKAFQAFETNEEKENKE